MAAHDNHSQGTLVAWTARSPESAGRLLATSAVLAAGLLWSSSGWSGLALLCTAAVLVAVGVAARALPLLPRWLRRRAGLLSGGAGLTVLALWSAPWAILLAAGVVLLGATVRLPSRWRHIGLGVAVLLATAGVVGLVVERQVAAAAGEAQAATARDHAREQMLPHSPAGVLYDLARVIARPDGRPGVCGLLFTDQGAAQFAAAYAAPDCPTALRAASSRVTDPQRYDRIDPATISVRADQARTVVVDGCRARWRESLDVLLGNPDTTPGPAIGVISVAPAYVTAWQIVGYRR